MREAAVERFEGGSPLLDDSGGDEGERDEDREDDERGGEHGADMSGVAAAAQVGLKRPGDDGQDRRPQQDIHEREQHQPAEIEDDNGGGQQREISCGEGWHWPGIVPGEIGLGKCAAALPCAESAG